MMSPVLAMAIGIVVMLLLIIFTRMHAFPALIISAVLIAILAMPVGDVINTVTTGFGNTMKSIGIVIGFGCIMGIFLEKSGAAKRMALTILKLVGVKNCDISRIAIGDMALRMRFVRAELICRLKMSSSI